MKTKSAILAMFCVFASPMGASAAAAESNERGEQLFGLCAQCHGEQGLGVEVNLSPAIAGQEQWYLVAQLHKFKAGIRGTHFDDIGGMRMRPMALTLRSDEDIEAVATYAANLPPGKPASTLEGGDPEKGKTHFAVCLACHGPNGDGQQALNAPALNHNSDWYLLKQLKNFRAGVRGAKPEDTTGALMRPMAATLPDEQALRDVIAYIMTLTPR